MPIIFLDFPICSILRRIDRIPFGLASRLSLPNQNFQYNQLSGIETS